MIDPVVLIAFVPAALALNLTPGADMMFCLAQGTRGGSRAALAASAGISAGAMVHVTVAGLGLGAVIASVPVAFDVIRWLGVAYLLWLAWRTLRTPFDTKIEAGVQPARAFRDGLLVNLTNPKVILFILAFVPQFVAPERAILPQFLVFGAILATGGFVVNALVGVFAGHLGTRLSRAPRAQLALRWLSATIFGALALRLALESRRA